MLPKMFHKVEPVEKSERAAANFKEFKGDGSALLREPGLKKVNRVRVGATELPKSIKESVPTDLTHSKFEEHEFDMYQLDVDGTGTPVLLRSIKSNDGLWQDGVSVYIDGEWEKPADGKKADAKKPADTPPQ